MTSLTKKLTLTLLAAFSSVCIAFGLFTAVPKASFAAEGDSSAPAPVVLDADTDFTFDSNNANYLRGLSDKRKAELKEESNTDTYSLVIPDSVTAIAANAFSGYTKITGITIPENVEYIENLAFAGLTNLTEINFYATECVSFSSDVTQNPFLRAGISTQTGVTVNLGKAGGAAVKAIPAYMFYNNIGNPNKISTVNFVNVNLEHKFSDPDANGLRTNLTFGTRAFAGCAYLTAVNFDGSTVTSIGDYAFSQCSALSSITIPSEVKTIGSNAFSYCSAFSTVVVPASVTSIGLGAFSNCANLAKIEYYAKNASGLASSPFTGSGKSIAVEIIGEANSQIELNAYLFRTTNISSVKLSYVKSIGQEAFANCNQLTSVTFENCSVASTGFGVFSDCTALREIELPDTLTSINEATFRNCTSLYNVKIPTGVTSIGAQAFYACSSLYAINIPDSVTSIGASAFYACSSIYTVSIPSGVTSIGANAFRECTKLIVVNDQSTALTIVAGQERATGNTADDYTGEYAKYVYDGSQGEDSLIEEVGGGYVFFKGNSDTDNEYPLLLGYVGEKTELNLSEDLKGTDYATAEYVIYTAAFRGNPYITKVTLPNNVYDINNFAFYGCTALTSVKLPEGLVYIRNSVFCGCTALTSINIPSSVTQIMNNAFNGCTRLNKVTFNKHVVSGDVVNDEPPVYKLTNIGTSAFENCSSLVSIDIPNTVTGIGGYAFRNCTNLSAIYMPDALSSYNVPGLFNGCNSSKLIIIVPAENYYNYDGNFSVYNYGKIAYIVNLHLISVKSDATDEICVERLYGCAYDFEKQEDGTWKNTGKMPVQAGYETSVWYSNEDLSGKIEGDDLTVLLDNAAANDPAITLYAKYLAKPKLEMDTTSEQYGRSGNIGYDRIFKNYQAGSGYGIEIKEYRLVGGALATAPASISDAGEYTLVVVIADGDAYGVWEQTDDITFTFTVTPAPRPIESMISWITVDANGNKQTLLSSNDVVPEGVDPEEAGLYPLLYLYGGSETSSQTPYLTEQKEDSSLFQGTVFVTNSYVRYVGNGSSIVALDQSLITDNSFTVTAYDGGEGAEKAVGSNGKVIGVTAADAGVYIAEATLKGSNNYILTYALSTAESGVGIVLDTRLTSSGYVYTLQKTWYIAMADGNSLLLGQNAFTLPKLPASISDDGGFGWVYGDEDVKSQLAAPTLQSAAASELGKLITFEITNPDIWGYDDDGLAIHSFTYDKYTDYINYTMPAGNYDLTINVAATGDYAAYSRHFSFEVAKADYSDKLAGWGVTGPIYGDLYKGIASQQSFTLEYRENEVQFADTSSLEVLNPDLDIYVREGVWADRAYNDCYEKFTIVYNLDGLSNYYTADKIASGPSSRGKYTVYFNIVSSNYASLVDTSSEHSRKTYSYILYIQETIDVDAIALDSITYTGNEIRLPDTDYYKFVYLNGSDADSIRAVAAYGSNDEYVTAGTHYVAVMIRTGFTDGYGWKEGNTIKVYTETLDNTTVNYYFAIREIVIGEAQNETTKPLSLGDWTYGEQPNSPVWSTRFVRSDEADFDSKVTFRLQSLNNPADVYYYTATEANQRTFADAPAGEYRLIASAVGGTVGEVKYNWATLTVTYEYTVTIHKAVIGLISEPYIESWKYGDYEAGNIAPEFAFEEAFSSLKTTYYITTHAEYEKLHSGEATEEEITRYVDVEHMLDANGQLPAGNYVLVLKLDDGEAISGNYETWSYAVYFSVVKTANYWTTTPSVHDWVYGDYSTRNIEMEYAPKYGNKYSVIFNYYSVDENNIRTSQPYTTISALIPKGSAELPVGKYEMCAYLDGTNNYERLALEHAYFFVTKAENGWKTDGVPGVKSWSQGNWNANENQLTASPIFGDLVEFSVYAASDTERAYPYDIKKLNDLGVGSYVLVAYVAGGANYEDLISETTFAVFEDSVGMTGLIAVTMVFAVLAVGLAVGGIIMLIRRNKIIEDEFRRMIKTELRRK